MTFILFLGAFWCKVGYKLVIGVALSLLLFMIIINVVLHIRLRKKQSRFDVSYLLYIVK